MTKITIHTTGEGTCCLTGRETEGLTVSFEDGTFTNVFLSWKGFRQILGLKAGTKPEVKPAIPVRIEPNAVAK